MVGTEQLEKLIAITLFTGHIVHENPVSLILIATPESGKTELMKKFAGNKGVEYLNDVTAYGIMRRYKEDIEMGRVRHFMFPDLCTPLARDPHTVATLIAFLNGLVEEGITAIETYAQPNIRLKLGQHQAVGIITGITAREMKERKRVFGKVGFLSRMLPVSYTYANSTRLKILESIAARQYQQDGTVKLELPRNPWKVHLPIDYARRITSIAVAKTDDGLFGFRKQKQLQTLMMGSALSEEREEVQQKDFDLVVELSDFIGVEKEMVI